MNANEVHRRQLRDPRVLLHWLLQQPRHQAELLWLRLKH
jgi:hypothetical protein